jgi:hypothetical protein
VISIVTSGCSASNSFLSVGKKASSPSKAHRLSVTGPSSSAAPAPPSLDPPDNEHPAETAASAASNTANRRRLIRTSIVVGPTGPIGP